MPEVTASAAATRPIELGDRLWAFNPTPGMMPDDAQATDTLSEVIATIFGNPPTSILPTAAMNIRAITDTLDVAGVDTRAALRFTGPEKTKLGNLNDILNAGSGTQTVAQFAYGAFTGYDPTTGFPSNGQFVLFTVGAITVGANAAVSVTIEFDGIAYTLTTVGGKEVPLDEFKANTEYLGLGRGLAELFLIGPNDPLEDDVIDVTNTGLPALDVTNYRKFFIDHDTPRVWVGHRESTPGTPAAGTFDRYTRSNYAGEHSSTPSVLPLLNAHYYNTTSHSWFGVVSRGFPPTNEWRQSSFSVIFSNASWLGEQPDDTTAANLVQHFSASRRYFYYNTGTGHVEELNNSSFVAAVTPDPHYVAEPISAPSGVGVIAGVTAGAGLTGGGLSGVVTVNMDAGEVDFPIIPVDKGGTGAATADAARTNLGLGTAATLDAGDAATNLAPLQADASFLPGHLAPLGTDGQVLTRTATGKVWADPTGMGGGLTAVAHDGTLAGDGTAGTPLRLADNAVTERHISADNAPINNQVLSWDNTNDVLFWANPGGGLATVATDTSISGDGSSGDPLSVDETGAAFPVIPLDKGGTGAADAAGARTALGLGTAAILDYGHRTGRPGGPHCGGRVPRKRDSDGSVPVRFRHFHGGCGHQQHGDQHRRHV